MLAVGARFSAIFSSGQVVACPIPSRLIHIDIDPTQPGKNYPVEIGIHADAKAGSRPALVCIDALDARENASAANGSTAAQSSPRRVRVATRWNGARRSRWGMMQSHSARALCHDEHDNRKPIPHLLGYWGRS